MRSQNKALLTGHAKSGIKTLKSAEQTRTYLNGTVRAKRVVVAASDVELKTNAHALNPRNQDALTKEAVRDIFPSIVENGVNVEGVAIRCPESEQLLLLDASRRRFSCILGGVDLPLWELQGDITDEQILAIINDSQEVKRWSYPEHADFLMRVASRKSLDINTMKVEELAKALSIGRESLRKRLEARNVSLDLREIFPDYEGVPNAFYSRLAKVERSLSRANRTPADFIKHIKKTPYFESSVVHVSEKQSEIMGLLEMSLAAFLGDKKVKRQWETKPLAVFEDKKAFARSSKSPDGNTLKIELSRTGAEKMKLVEKYIKSILEGKITD